MPLLALRVDVNASGNRAERLQSLHPIPLSRGLCRAEFWRILPQLDELYWR